MKGIYGYDVTKKRWYWHVDYMHTEVASGYCKHRGELDKVIQKHPMVNWYKDTDFAI